MQRSPDKSNSASVLKRLQEAIHDHFPSDLESLERLIQHASISAYGFTTPAIQECADAVFETAKAYGFSDVEKIELPGSAPYIVGRAESENSRAPTVLIYAHYDVQPIANPQKWLSLPFKATQRNGRLFGRGSADDKAGVIAALSAPKAFQESGVPLPVNLKFLMDGEEESGSPNLKYLLKHHKKSLKADFLIVPDLVNPNRTTPSLTFSLRGLVEFKIRVRALKRAVHSGLGGGVAPDATAALAQLYARALGPSGEVTIPGLRKPSALQKQLVRDLMGHLKWTEAKAKKELGLQGDLSLLHNNPGRFFEALWFRPALTLVQMQVAEPNNYSNRLQTDAEAIFSLRIPPGQNPHEAVNVLKKFFLTKVPFDCKVDFSTLQVSKGFFMNPQHSFFQQSLEAVSSAYKRQAVAIGAGLSIPFVDIFLSTFPKMKTILLGIEDPYSNAHGENESISLSMFENTIRSVAYLLQTFGTL